MRSSLMAVTFDVRDPAQAARFWADMLGRNFVETSNGVLLRGDATQLGLGFAPCHIEKSGPNRVHLHITSTTDADQQQTVEKALSLGARHLDVGQRPEEGHVVLADPGDNEFCVIEPDNSFLDGMEHDLRSVSRRSSLPQCPPVALGVNVVHARFAARAPR
jgi:catechol 2,3-dioxygenase-like lactoylglutathione lyase family enzyme